MCHKELTIKQFRFKVGDYADLTFSIHEHCPYSDDFLNKFLRRINIPKDQNKDLCWNWTKGCSSTGYGNVRANNKYVGTHRVAYQIFNGPIKDKTHYVCHKCDNPRCCNPHHLFLGSVKDNTQDASKKGRLQIGKVLTPMQVKQIKASEGSYEQLGIQFKVSPKIISDIKHGTIWKFIDNMTNDEIMEATIKQEVNKQVNQIKNQHPDLNCIICEKTITKKQCRNGRCKTCDSYYRRNGTERPYGSVDGRGNQGSKHSSAKLTEDQVREIKSLLHKKTNAALAREYNVSWPTINKIRNGSRWGYVK